MAPLTTVFPARAGMSPVGITVSNPGAGFPRPRGDEPSLCKDFRKRPRFSPPARG